METTEELSPESLSLAVAQGSPQQLASDKGSHQLGVWRAAKHHLGTYLNLAPVDRISGVVPQTLPMPGALVTAAAKYSPSEQEHHHR